MVLVNMFDIQVGNHIGGLGSGEQRDACPVAQKAQVAEVGYNMDRRVPG